VAYNKTYRLWIRAGSSIPYVTTWGNWSNAVDFTVTPYLPPTLNASTGNITQAQPTFQWSSISGATKYELWVDNISDGLTKIIWQPSLTGASFTPASALSKGKTYRWWVRAGGPNGWGAWSNAMDFTVK
jgi:hypothetical protein